MIEVPFKRGVAAAAAGEVKARPAFDIERVGNDFGSVVAIDLDDTEKFNAIYTGFISYI